MFEQCIATVIERKEDGVLSELKVFITPNEFLAEHGNCSDSADLVGMTNAIEDAKEGVLGMFDLATQPWHRIFYMVGDDPKQTQDELRLAVYERGEHTRFLEKE